MDETRYTGHDVKIEAIDESIEGRLRAYSTFLFEAVERYLPATNDIEHQLHENYAGRLFNRSLIWDPQVLEQHCERALTLNSECANAHTTYANLLSGPLDDPEMAKEHHECALSLDPELALAHNNYALLLKNEYDAVEEAKEHYEQALTIDPDLGPANGHYGHLLYHVLDDPEEAKPYFETALRSFEAVGRLAGVLYALRQLIRVCRVLDDEATALEYCDRALTYRNDDSADISWFETIHTILIETDCRTRYIHGLTAVCDEHHNLSKELFELVWTNRSSHLPGSEAHDLALAAGVMFTALVRHDEDSSQTCKEIIDSIDPSSLSFPVSLLYESLDGGTTDSLDVSRTDDPPQDLPPLERQAVACLLGRREDSDTY